MREVLAHWLSLIKLEAVGGASHLLTVCCEDVAADFIVTVLGRQKRTVI